MYGIVLEIKWMLKNCKMTVMSLKFSCLKFPFEFCCHVYVIWYFIRSSAYFFLCTYCTNITWTCWDPWPFCPFLVSWSNVSILFSMYSIIEIEWMLKQYKLMIMSLNFGCPHEKISSYLYVYHLCFECMTYVCKINI